MIPISPTIGAERLTVLSTPAAKLLLVASALMAAVSCTANLGAVDDLASDSALEIAMHSSTVATLVFSLLAGIYSATTDHRFGLIDQRALSEPRRSRVLVAKATVAAAVGLGYGLLGAITGALAAYGFYRVSGVDIDLSSPVVVKALLGVVLAAPLFAVLGVCIGLIVRNQPTAIGGALAWLMIVEPTLIVGLPDVGGWLPGAAGLALTNSPDEAILDQLTGSFLLTTYVVTAYLIAAHRFNRADL